MKQVSLDVKYILKNLKTSYQVNTHYNTYIDICYKGVFLVSLSDLASNMGMLDRYYRALYTAKRNAEWL